MDQLQFRSKAKVVAVVDLIVTSLFLWLVFVLFLGTLAITMIATGQISVPEDEFGGGKATSPGTFDDDGLTKFRNMDRTTLTTIVVAMWIFFVIFLATVVLEMVAAIKLINATQIGADPVDAIKKATFWRNVTLIFTVMAIVRLLFGRGSILILISIVFKLLGIWIVNNYIKEIQSLALNHRVHMFYDVEGGGIVPVPGPGYPHQGNGIGPPQLYPNLGPSPYGYGGNQDAPPSYAEVQKVPPAGY